MPLSGGYPAIAAVVQFITMENEGPHQLDHRMHRPSRHGRSWWRPFLDCLAYLCFPAIPIAFLTGVDGLVNAHSDFVPAPWFAMFGLAVGCVAWWAILRRRDRQP
jgi:hypothetical protein